MIQLRYPNITGKTPEERQAQMERYTRSLIDQLNMMISKNGDTQKAEQFVPAQDFNLRFSKLEKKIDKDLKTQQEEFKKLWETIYPVGSIYISTSDISPQELFGGEWDKIQDRFLLAEGTHEAGETGGEENHVLTIEEMPEHDHRPQNYDEAGSNSGYSRQFTTNLHTDSDSVSLQRVTASSYSGQYVMAAKAQGDIEGTDYTSKEGGGQEHNNMPPYLSVYMWKRIQ